MDRMPPSEGTPMQAFAKRLYALICNNVITILASLAAIYTAYMLVGTLVDLSYLRGFRDGVDMTIKEVGRQSDELAKKYEERLRDRAQ